MYAALRHPTYPHHVLHNSAAAALAENNLFKIEFEDLFNRFDKTYLINKGDALLTIDSLSFNESYYIIDFEDNRQLPFTIVPDDSIEMNVTLSGFYHITVSDTSDTIYVYNDGINNPEPLRVKIDFFDDEYGDFNGIHRA